MYTLKNYIMKIELIKYNDEGLTSYWVRVDGLMTNQLSELFYNEKEADDYFNALSSNQVENSNIRILKTITL